MLKTKNITIKARTGQSDLNLDFEEVGGVCPVYVVRSHNRNVFAHVDRKKAVTYFNRRVRAWLKRDGRPVPRNRNDYHYIPN